MADDKRKAHNVTQTESNRQKLLLLGRFYNLDASHTIEKLVEERFAELKEQLPKEWVVKEKADS